MLRIVSYGIVSAILFAGWIGCGGGGDPNRPKTLPATVTVTYQSQAVEGATVTLHPSSAQERGAVAKTDARGRAAMWAYEPGGGAIPGAYDVTISKVEVLSLPSPDSVSPEEYARLAQEVEQALSQPAKQLLPERYSHAATSELSIEVVDGGKNDFAFELED